MTDFLHVLYLRMQPSSVWLTEKRVKRKLRTLLAFPCFRWHVEERGNQRQLHLRWLTRCYWGAWMLRLKKGVGVCWKRIADCWPRRSKSYKSGSEMTFWRNFLVHFDVLQVRNHGELGAMRRKQQRIKDLETGRNNFKKVQFSKNFLKNIFVVVCVWRRCFLRHQIAKNCQQRP